MSTGTLGGPAYLAIDEGTTSTRVAAFSQDGALLTQSNKTFEQFFPKPGWVEHDAEEIFRAVCETLETVLSGLGAHTPAAIGITNQRETVVVWDRATGKPVAPAIVWQDRRTAAFCDALKAGGHEDDVIARTGLLLDPYFTATKLRWLLKNVDGLQAKARQGKVLAGTIDAYLAYRLTGKHVTDHSNASRTLLYNLERGEWDDQLCALFGIERAILPHIVDTAGPIGAVQGGLPGQGVPICAIAGDQQAATIGQACLQPGQAKATYGTGCFLLANTGLEIKRSHNRLLSTVLSSLKGQRTFALEGSIFVAGSLMQWLRDSLQLIESAEESEALARSVDDSAGVVIVPALAGLGAPYWNPHARGAILGLTRGATRAHVVRAALEAQSYQTHDLIVAMGRDGQTIDTLRVDGGMVSNEWLCQDLADVLGIALEKPAVVETTALGAAMLACLGVGDAADLKETAHMWQPNATFEPGQPKETVRARLRLWHDAIGRVDQRALGEG
ncbi:MAG: glycerol kinase GlpK [Pseudomonadota bacterium]